MTAAGRGGYQTLVLLAAMRRFHVLWLRIRRSRNDRGYAEVAAGKRTEARAASACHSAGLSTTQRKPSQRQRRVEGWLPRKEESSGFGALLPHEAPRRTSSFISSL